MMSGPAHARVASASGSGIEGGEPDSELGSTLGCQYECTPLYTNKVQVSYISVKKIL